MTYVEKFEISFIINKLCVQFMVFSRILYCFVAKSVFLCIYAVLSRNRFVAMYVQLRGENCALDKYQVWYLGQ